MNSYINLFFDIHASGMVAQNFQGGGGNVKFGTPNSYLDVASPPKKQWECTHRVS